MLFRQLFDHDSSTYGYLLADGGTREVLVIDPHSRRGARPHQEHVSAALPIKR